MLHCEHTKSTHWEHPLGAPTARQTFLEKEIGKLVSVTLWRIWHMDEKQSQLLKNTSRIKITGCSLVIVEDAAVNFASGI